MTVDTPPTAKVVVCYLRLSPRGRPDTGLGIEAQRRKCAALVDYKLAGWTVEWVEERASGRHAASHRPALASTLRRLDRGDVQALAVASLDRLTRRVVHLLEILDQAEGGGWRVIIPDLDIDTGRPVGRAIVTILGTLAQMERELISERTQEALAVARARGVVLGRPTGHSPETLATVRELRDRGDSLQRIADFLNAEGIPTAQGGQWHRQTVARALRTESLHTAAAAIRAEEQPGLFDSQ